MQAELKWDFSIHSQPSRGGHLPNMNGEKKATVNLCGMEVISGSIYVHKAVGACHSPSQTVENVIKFRSLPVILVKLPSTLKMTKALVLRVKGSTSSCFEKAGMESLYFYFEFQLTTTVCDLLKWILI